MSSLCLLGPLWRHTVNSISVPQQIAFNLELCLLHSFPDETLVSLHTVRLQAGLAVARAPGLYWIQPWHILFMVPQVSEDKDRLHLPCFALSRHATTSE